jgi:predicted neuraminidase
VSTWSKDDGETWQPLKALDLPNPNSGTDAVSLANGKQLLVYNPLTAGQNWWEGRSALKLASSTNGTDWNDIYTLENHKKGEYSYPAIIQSTNGHIHITYTSERKKIKYIKLAL